MKLLVHTHITLVNYIMLNVISLMRQVIKYYSSYNIEGKRVEDDDKDDLY